MDSITAKAKEQLTQPYNQKAADLWKHVAVTYKEQEDVKRARLWSFITSLTSRQIGDKKYLEKFLFYKTQLTNMGAIHPDSMYFDLLRTNMSEHSHRLLQDKMDLVIANPALTRPDHNLFKVIKHLLAWLPNIP
ncbi:hypothetical protein KEM55_001098, partial [Ascosphaera atra]